MTAKKVILVIEDEPVIQSLLIDIFTDTGCFVVAASTAEKGLELLESLKIDLITLDLQLPGMGGVAFLQCLSQTEKEIPVVVISANTFLVPNTYKLTLVKKVMQKPFNINEVTGLVSEFCQ